MINDQKVKVLLENDKYWGTLKNTLLEDVDYHGTKHNKKHFMKTMDILMENERHALTESVTMATNISPIVKTILGLTKKFLPKLIANEIVSVQPMKSPVSVVKFKKVYVNNTEVPDFNSTTPDGLPTDDATVPHALSGNITIASSTGNIIFESVNTWNPIAPNSVVVTLNGTTITDNGNGQLTGTLEDGTTVTGTVDYNKGIVSLNLSGSTTSGTATVTCSTKGFEMNSDVERLTYEIENLPISALNRKLKASWTYEAQEDAQSELGGFMDFTSEIYDDVASYIAQELNREIITDLVTNASTTGSWEYKSYGDIGYATAEAYFRTLLYEINGVSAQITKKIKVSQPNFVVVSPALASVIEDGLSQWSSKENGVNGANFAELGYAMVGQISGKYNLYVTPSISDSQALIGYKGNSLIDSGYVYAPYVPLKGVPITYEPTPGIMLRTRYGKKLYAPWYYGKVNVTNFHI